MKNKKDSLGDRMKTNYEGVTKYLLPRKTYTIIRLDGKAFHTYTRGMEKPFDETFMQAMIHTTKQLCKSIQGAVLGYTQSDEITLVLHDMSDIKSEPWFGGKVQKIVSVAASMCTAHFNKVMQYKDSTLPLALFDARVFTISNPVEVHNCLVWRQQDAIRNSKQSFGQAILSTTEMFKLSVDKVIQKCKDEHNMSWWDLEDYKKQGTTIVYDCGWIENSKFTFQDDIEKSLSFMVPELVTISDVK